MGYSDYIASLTSIRFVENGDVYYLDNVAEAAGSR